MCAKGIDLAMPLSQRSRRSKITLGLRARSPIERIGALATRKKRSARAKPASGETLQTGLRASAARAGDRASQATARARALAKRAREQGVRQAKNLREQTRDQVRGRLNAARPPLEQPHLCFVQSPRRPISPPIMSEPLRVATYNVHRWQGVNGRAKPDVARAGYVISELEADVIALQEVLRPDDAGLGAEDELGRLCEELDLHLAFAATRRHRRGQLGNAILSRFPITSISVLDISYSRIERRGALAAQVGCGVFSLGVVATHLSLVDRTRHRQVASLMAHPALNAGSAVLMGDMNAWRNCKGSQVLQESLGLHHNHDWPASFPASRPLLALDRIYSRNADVIAVFQHDTPAARRASDHLPVVAELDLKAEAME
jgi:endonuclease/exonuclease/phosphatase family metal-dependent hydrolase